MKNAKKIRSSRIIRPLANFRLALAVLALGVLSAGVLAQAPSTKTAVPPDPKQIEAKQKEAADRAAMLEALRKQQSMAKAEAEGVDVRVKDVARFRGVRPNQLIGTGLVLGLAGTGDTKKSVITSQIISNLFKDIGISVPPEQIDMKNVAAVMITAELPPFAQNGQQITVNVESMGDAKSLVGGTLLQSTMYAAGDRQTVYAVAQGQVTVGGYDVSSGGSSSSKGHVTAGSIPGGAIVERGAATRLVYDGKMYLDLDEQDMTTAQRLVTKINEKYPEFLAHAENGGTIDLTLPAGMNPVDAIAQIEVLHVMSDTAATIVINEKTGTIIIGANVRVGAAAIAQGSISVKIDTTYDVSQPAPFSNGQTVVTKTSAINANEPTAQVATIAPNTTIQDLAKIFQALELKPKDIISILKALRDQGALKARIITQ